MEDNILMEFTIRAYQSSDLAAVSRVCLGTGDNGRDATSLYKDPDLLGSYFTSPYVVFEPDLGFVLVHDAVPCGYVLGTRDTVTFCERCEREWFPALRAHYPLPDVSDMSPDAAMIRMIHAGREKSEVATRYPAHLHLDLLPIAQGQGWGPKMMRVFIDRLQSLQIPGVHLSVGKANHRAIGFYQKMGFQRIDEEHQSLIMGRLL